MRLFPGQDKNEKRIAWKHFSTGGKEKLTNKQTKTPSNNKKDHTDYLFLEKKKREKWNVKSLKNILILSENEKY